MSNGKGKKYERQKKKPTENNIFQKEVDDKRQRKKMEIWKGRQKENKENRIGKKDFKDRPLRGTK